MNKENTDAMLSQMKRKVKTKKIIMESLQEDTNEETLSLLDEKNILDSWYSNIYKKYIVGFVKNEEEHNEKTKT